LTETPPVPVDHEKQILDDAWSVTKRAFVPALPFVALRLAVSWGLFVARGTPFPSSFQEAVTAAAEPAARSIFSLRFLSLSLVQEAIDIALLAVLLRLMLDGLERRPVPGAALRGLRRYLPFLAVSFLVSAAVTAGGVACVIPGVYLGLSLAIALPIVLEEGAGPIDALRIAWARMEGFRTTAFLCTLVMGVVFLVLPGVAWMAIALATTTMARAGGEEGLFQAMQVLGIVSGAIWQLLWLPWLALLAALHRHVARARAAPPPDGLTVPSPAAPSP
jgi:hypothetical protein